MLLVEAVARSVTPHQARVVPVVVVVVQIQPALQEE
jgi:hypothetical protein